MEGEVTLETRNNFVSVSEAAEILGIDRSRVGRLCREGRFEGATKIGEAWIIPREAVLNHTHLKPGPKTKAARREEDAALLKAVIKGAVDEAKNQEGGE